jgi:hypothetical protein
MQNLEDCNDIAEVDRADIRSKQAVNYNNFRRRRMLAEPVRCAQHVRHFQRRVHGGKAVRHIIAEPTCGTPDTHTDPR